ncbi:MAG TPA: hypothetical protein VK474_11700 [Chthoniobacterales bacterium]|nr:hypothetical protein [Chthoniobacterales bacterium]
MSAKNIPPIQELERRPSPAATPQALAWHDGALWMGSRDLRRIYALDPKEWRVREEFEAPGIPWAAVSVGDALWFTLGEGADDDRYLRRFVPGQGFAESDRIACPEFTGSYLGYDGDHLHLSQWYKHRILKLDAAGNTLRSFDVGAEICGYTFVDGLIYVLRGTEQGEEDWRIARFDPRDENPQVEDLASIPFQSRSLAFDGERFWSNHRAADAIISFTLPL